MRTPLLPVLSLLFLIPTLSRSQAKSSPSAHLPNVAVLPLSSQGVDSASAQVLTDALSDELLKSGKVRVMERSQMAEVLKEQGFQNSGSCDQSECAVQMGKLLGIEEIVVGSLGRFGNTYTVSLRGVDVATGEVVASVRKLQKGEMDAILTDLLPSVAQELATRLSGGTPAKDSSAVAAKSIPEPAPVVVAPPTVAPVVPPAPVAPVAPSTDASSASSSGGGSHWGWWVAGGAVVAGGAAAAVLLTQSHSNSSTNTAATSPSNSSWQTKVEW